MKRAYLQVTEEVIRDAFGLPPNVAIVGIEQTVDDKLQAEFKFLLRGDGLPETVDMIEGTPTPRITVDDIWEFTEQRTHAMDSEG